jgi:hypothetical protein
MQHVGGLGIESTRRAKPSGDQPRMVAQTVENRRNR